MIQQLPPWLAALVTSVPKPGEGHGWLYRVSRHLHAHLPAPKIVSLLEQSLANSGHRFTRREIADAVRNSIGCAWEPRGGGIAPKPAPKWPAVDQNRRDAIVRDGGGLVDLWEASPIRLEDNKPHTEAIIDHLFPGNPLLCCGGSQSEFDTKPREAWRGQLTGQQFLVPSPMTAETGLTKDSRESAHTLSNTGPRRFLICEFDTRTIDEHAALLLHLATFAPLVCVPHSGGKSLHGWFFVEGQPDDKVYKFFRYAVALGADSRMWTRCQFVRVPDGTRDNGNRQTVFFLSFKPMEGRP